MSASPTGLWVYGFFVEGLGFVPVPRDNKELREVNRRLLAVNSSRPEG